MDNTLQILEVANSTTPSSGWSWDAIGTMLMVVATFCVAGTTFFTGYLALVANRRQEKERSENLKRERAERLVNLINFILEHKELLYNKTYPMYDKDECYETVIGFNVMDHEKIYTKKTTHHNFVIVRERGNNDNILSFTFIGEYRVDPMSVDIDMEPEYDPGSEKWEKLFDALIKSLNLALFQTKFAQSGMREYYEMDTEVLNKITGLFGEVRGHVGMNSKFDRKLVNAILSIDVKSVKKLVKKITHIDARDMEGKTFIHYAVRDAHSQIISNENLSFNEEEATHKGISKTHVMKMQKDLNLIISILIDEGADVNAKDNRGNSVIYYAASTNNPQAIYILETSGSDVNAVSNHNGGTAIYAASHNGWDDVVEKLIQHGAKLDCRDSDGEPPLHMASASGWASTIKKLIDHGLSIEDRNKFEETPLHKASLSEDIDAVDVLVQSGAKRGINDKDELGETPLHNASWQGSVPMIKTLIRHGADTDIRNKKGETPLHIALRNIGVDSGRYAAAADALIEHGADLFCKDKNGDSPDYLILKLINRHRWYHTILDELKQKLNAFFTS